MFGRGISGVIDIFSSSEGTMMTQNGMDLQQDNIAETVQNNSDNQFLLQYSGAPVNHVIAQEQMTEIYGGKEGIETHMGEGSEISDVFRSNATPGDGVAGVLGYQGAGINSSENMWSNLWEGIVESPRLFGGDEPSPHSYYPCVIGCGDENYTPTINNYYTPNQPDKNNEPQSPMTQYYQENFMVQDKDGTERMTIDLGLLPYPVKESTKNANDNNGSK